MLDRFGGWADITSKATGFFRVEEIEGRWWFIDPDGNAFISVGVNHIHSRDLQKPWNRHVYEEKYGNEETFFTESEKRLKEWNFNTVGPFSRYPEFVGEDGMPYLYNLSPEEFPLARWQSVYGRKNREWVIPDVFSDEWKVKVENVLEPLCKQYRDDPLFIGYCYVDIPCWDQVELWVESIIKTTDTPGKMAYVKLMRERYPDIGDWNSAHNTNYRDFDDIIEDTDPHKRSIKSWAGFTDRDRINDDDHAFLGHIASRYYEVLGETIRRNDGNHLIIGDRYDGNHGVPEEVLRSTGKYTDVLGIQYYPVDHYRGYEHHNSVIKQYYEIVGKPVFLVDLAFSVPSRTMPAPFGAHVSDQRERGRKYAEYFKNAFEIPFVIGMGWCGYIDGSYNVEPLWQHSGIIDEFDEPHEDFIEQVKKTNETLYSIAARGTDK